MGLLNTILGRTKPVQSDLDALFALPSASITLQSAAGMSCSGHAGVCFKPPTGQGFEEMQAEVVKLLAMDGTDGFQKAEDAYGYHWLVIEDSDIEELVTRIHLVNSSLADAGWGPQLLCSVFGIAELAVGDEPPELAESLGESQAADAAEAGQPPASGQNAEATDPMPEPTAGPGRVIPSTGLPGLPVQAGIVLSLRPRRTRETRHGKGTQAEEPGSRRPENRARPRPLVPLVGSTCRMRARVVRVRVRSVDCPDSQEQCCRWLGPGRCRAG